MDVEKSTRRKRSWRKSQLVVASVLSLGVLTGSAFLNPTMAEVISKIPYLGQVFQKPIPVVMSEVLEKEGYKPAGVGMSMWEGKSLFDMVSHGLGKTEKGRTLAHAAGKQIRNRHWVSRIKGGALGHIADF